MIRCMGGGRALRAGASVLLGCLLRGGTGDAAVRDHLACFKIKDPLAGASYTADLDALAVEEGCTIRVPAKVACVASSKTNVTPTPPGGVGNAVLDPFVCYKVKCAKQIHPGVAAPDQFGSRTLEPGRATV